MSIKKIVYCVYRVDHWDGETLRGVYENRADAEALMEKLKNDEGRYRAYYVYPVELNTNVD